MEEEDVEEERARWQEAVNDTTLAYTHLLRTFYQNSLLFFNSDDEIDKFTQEFNQKVGEVWDARGQAEALGGDGGFDIISLIDHMCPFGARIGRFEPKKPKKNRRKSKDADRWE